VRQVHVKELRTLLRHQGVYLGEDVTYNGRDNVSVC